MEVFIWTRREVTRIAGGCITWNSSLLVRVLLRLEEPIPGSSALCFRAFPEHLCNHSADHVILKMDNYSSGKIKEKKMPSNTSAVVFFLLLTCWKWDFVQLFFISSRAALADWMFSFSQVVAWLFYSNTQKKYLKKCQLALLPKWAYQMTHTGTYTQTPHTVILCVFLCSDKISSASQWSQHKYQDVSLFYSGFHN